MPEVPAGTLAEFATSKRPQSLTGGVGGCPGRAVSGRIARSAGSELCDRTAERDQCVVVQPLEVVVTPRCARLGRADRLLECDPADAGLGVPASAVAAVVRTRARP